MALTPAAFTDALLREAQETHPWLHHPLFRMIWDGKLDRRQLQSVIRQQGCFFLDTLRHAAWKIVSVGGYSPTFEDLKRQLSALAYVKWEQVQEKRLDLTRGKVEFVTVPGGDEVHNVAVLEAIVESARTRAPVSIAT